jgi:hypothetical protein
VFRLPLGSLACLPLLLGGAARAAEDAKSMAFFESKIRPVLVNQCYECHSNKAPKVRGGLLLDTKDGLRSGGDTGPAIVPGDPDKSLLIKALSHDGLKMPPKQKVSSAVVADFVQWVKMGAPDPRTSVNTAYKRMSADEAKTFWSFQPPDRVPCPASRTRPGPRERSTSLSRRCSRTRASRPTPTPTGGRCCAG